MSNQLQAFVDGGGKIEVKGRAYTFGGMSSDADIAIATLKTARSSYSAVRCVNTTVRSKPGAEVWSIIGGKRAVADFAVHEGRIYTLG